MSEAKHTPGPWRKNKFGNIVCYPTGLEIGVLDKRLPSEELNANENLILAAPELLEALKGFVDWLEDEEGPMLQIGSALGAIAKAEGRSP